MEKLLDKVTKSPLKDFASSKEGITVMPEITRLWARDYIDLHSKYWYQKSIFCNVTNSINTLTLINEILILMNKLTLYLKNKHEIT